MELENYLKELEKDFSAIPGEQAARKMMELGRARDGIYPLQSDGEEISIRRSYDKILALDIRAELDKATEWLVSCMDSSEFTNEHVHLCFAFGWGKVAQPYAHKAIYRRLSGDDIIPYELCDKNNGDVYLPIPKSEILVIHENYFSEFDEKGWEDEDGEEIFWEREPYNELFEIPTLYTFFMYNLPRYWASLFVTHAAIHAPRRDLLRGNSAFQLTVAIHDTTFLVGEVRDEGFLGFEALKEEFGAQE